MWLARQPVSQVLLGYTPLPAQHVLVLHGICSATPAHCHAAAACRPCAALPTTSRFVVTTTAPEYSHVFSSSASSRAACFGPSRSSRQQLQTSSEQAARVMVLDQTTASQGQTLAAQIGHSQAVQSNCAAGQHQLAGSPQHNVQPQQCQQLQQQQQQQQRQYDTQVLAIDPSSLPAVSAPVAAAVAQLLAADSAPDLIRACCPHLYYDWNITAAAAATSHSSSQVDAHGAQLGQDAPTITAAAAAAQFATGINYSSSSSGSNAPLYALQEAAKLIQADLPVAIPTETVYGLAANALSAPAVTAIFKAKGRPADNPLIVHVSDLDMLARLYPGNDQQQGSAQQRWWRQQQSRLSGHQEGSKQQQHELKQQWQLRFQQDALGCCNSSPSTQQCCHQQGFSKQVTGQQGHAASSCIPKQYHRLVAAVWPGPLTLLLPVSPLIPAVVTAGQPTMAVRMPAHPVARAIIAAAGVPLAAPSANTSGKPSPTTAQHVVEDLNGVIPAVVDGGVCGCGIESTVLDGLRVPPVVLRPGGVTSELLQQVPEMAGLQIYSRDFTDKGLESRPTTPGMKYRHYSPQAPLLLLEPLLSQQQQQQLQQGQQQSQQRQQQQALQQQQQPLKVAACDGPGVQLHLQLHQAIVTETQQLLQLLTQHQQLQDHQQQQVLQHKQQHVSQLLQQLNPVLSRPVQRVVLLSTCSSNDSSSATAPKLGWSVPSQAKAQQFSERPQQQQQQPKTLGSAVCFDAVSNGHKAIQGLGSLAVQQPEVLEYVLGTWDRVDLVAQQLFCGLRAADSVSADLVVVQGLLPTGTGLAVMNRLQKAASIRVPVAVTGV